jgi:hypothetical protein
MKIFGKYNLFKVRLIPFHIIKIFLLIQKTTSYCNNFGKNTTKMFFQNCGIKQKIKKYIM